VADAGPPEPSDITGLLADLEHRVVVAESLDRWLH
jgi:hypothetical protein